MGRSHARDVSVGEVTRVNVRGSRGCEVVWWRLRGGEICESRGLG